MARLDLELGDVEPLSWPRTRVRWPTYPDYLDAVATWMQALGMKHLPGNSDVAIMACRGARYHHDGEQYGGMAFCNLFVSEAKGLDLHFPALNLRIPLQRGTAVIFDTAQPHAVISRESHGFAPASFALDQDVTQFFLSWELPIENPAVASALQISFDTDSASNAQLQTAEVRLVGGPAQVCPATGAWLKLGLEAMERDTEG